MDKKCRQDRTYANFFTFMRENDEPALVQLDTVKGSKKGKTLFTLLFVFCGFMLVYLCEDNSAKSVKDIFQTLHKKFGDELFTTLLFVI